MKQSQSNFKLWSPDPYLVRSYLITAVFCFYICCNSGIIRLWRNMAQTRQKSKQNASLCSAKYAAGALFFTSYFLKGDSVSKDGAVMNVDYCLEMRFKTPCRV